MAKFNVAQAKAQFSELIQRALLGEEVVVARDNKPLVKIVPLQAPKRRRRPGSAKGQVWVAADFDATPEDFDEYV
jgi:prevent-host-death family protein